RVGLLRAVPGRGGRGSGVRRPPEPPDGPGERPRGAPGARDRSRRGRRHAHGQAGPRVSRHRPEHPGRVPGDSARGVQRERRVQHGEGRGRAGLDRRAPRGARDADRVPPRRSGHDHHVSRARRGRMARGRADVVGGEMSEIEQPILGHLTTYRLQPALWSLDPDERRMRARAWLEGLREVSDVAHLYLTQGIESEGDVLVWSTARVDDGDAAGRFFQVRSAAENRHRDVFEPARVLCGPTRPSEYSRAAKSAQAIASFAEERAPYLVMYPFPKTAEWYLLG